MGRNTRHRQIQAGTAHELQRTLTWKDAFWVTSGVPAGFLFTIGGVSASIGNPAWLVWIAAILICFAQSFVYAEISGLYPHKSGGASVYGALAWVRYSTVAPRPLGCRGHQRGHGRAVPGLLGHFRL